MIIKMNKRSARPSNKSYSYDPTRDGVSQSILSAWLECREKSRINIVQGWASNRISLPMIYGSISHGGVCGAYRDMRAKKIKKLDDLYRKIGEYLEMSIADWRLENPHADTESLDVVEESAAILTILLPRYFKYWFDEDMSVEWVHVEDKFLVPLKMPDGKTVPMVGRMDGSYRAKNKKGRTRLWLLETKNKGRWSDNIGDLLPLDLQLGYYLTGLEHKLSEDPEGAKYNLIRRPQEKRKVKEKLKDYCKRIEHNISKKPEHFFERMEIHFTKDEKEEHKFRAQKLVEEFYFWWKNTDVEKRDLMWNHGACENRYGTCGNLPICAHQDHTMHHVRATPSPELVAE